MTVYNIRKYKDEIKKTKVGSIEKIRVLGYTYYRVRKSKYGKVMSFA